MDQQRAVGRLVRFGVFEVDFREGLLSKAGRRIRLQDQPFRILALLVERPGQLVTREEIQQTLWSDDTFVDFDDGLNTAIRKLRTALGDSAENPRFIETVPRRGYRFLAPVTSEPSGDSGDHPVAAEPDVIPPVAVPEIVPEPLPEAAPRRFSKLRPLWLVAVLLIVAAAIFGGRYAYSRRHALQITSKDTIVLADFANTTGDPVFDRALKQGLIIGLEQSPEMNVLSDRKVASILKMMGRPSDQPLTQAAALEVCQRTSGKVVVAGSISSLGTQYLIGLAALRCDTGDPITHQQIEAKRKEDVIEALGDITTQVRAALGESIASIKKFDVPLEQATTTSLDALKAYSLALATWDRKGDEATVPFLKRAVELDPNFAMGYAALGTIYHNLNDPSLASDNMTKAYQLSEHLGDYEKLSIESRYHRYVAGDQEKAAQVYELITQTYPESAGAFSNLGSVYASLGQYVKAAISYRRALTLDPTRASTYANLAMMLLAQNQPDEVAALIAEADKRGLRGEYLIEVNYWNAFLRKDTASMQQILLHASDTPGAEALLIAAQSNTEAHLGHFVKSRELAGVAAELMQHEGDKEAAADYLAEAGLREAEIGSQAQARQYVNQALKLSPGLDVRTLSALTFARIGDLPRAQSLAEELGKQYPVNTFLQNYWLPAIHAQVELNQGNWQKAIDTLALTSRLESAWPTTITVATFYPAYIRGECYLAGNQGANAAMEFQKLLDHPGLVLNHPLHALSHLQLGRAYASAGLTERSRNSYSDFLDLWKDADSDIPILHQAKTEYAKLK